MSSAAGRTSSNGSNAGSGAGWTNAASVSSAAAAARGFSSSVLLELFAHVLLEKQVVIFGMLSYPPGDQLTCLYPSALTLSPVYLSVLCFGLFLPAFRLSRCCLPQAGVGSSITLCFLVRAAHATTSSGPSVELVSAVALALTVPLIRPLRWQSLLLPILPHKLLSFLDAPVPFVVGLPRPATGCVVMGNSSCS